MNTRREYAIIIVGGGPAGVATALHIARKAPALVKQMMILEAQEYPRPKLCGGGITVHGEEQLQKLGIQFHVPAFHIDQLTFKLGKNAFSVAHRDAMRIIQRDEYDAALADAAIRAGIQINTGERLLDVQMTDQGAELRTHRGHYHARVIIAADGAKSTVRQKLKFPTGQGIARLLRVMTPIDHQHTLASNKTALFDFSCIQDGIQGYMWSFPAYVRGEMMLNQGIFDSRIITPTAKPPHGQLKNSFEMWLNQQDIDLNERDLAGHPVRWFSRDAEFSRPHVLLAGDAAGVDALFAEGISYAMEYGEIIADVLIDAFQRHDFSFADYRQRLLSHRLGQLLQRRAMIARAIYQHRLPAAWAFLWHCAAIAPRPVQRAIGAWMAVLPPFSDDQHAYEESARVRGGYRWRIGKP